MQHEGLSKLPKCISIRLTGWCNLACPFCYGPHHSRAPVNTEKLLNLLDILPSLGVEHIGITGGEPLLDNNLSKILSKIKSKGMRVLLNTNGTILEGQIDEICPYLDWLALPLDSDDEEVQQVMRPGKYLNAVQLKNLILKIRTSYPGLKIRVGTVVSKINRSQIFGIPEMLSGIYAPDAWKLYEFTPSSYGWINKDTLELNQDTFEAIVQKAMEVANSYGIKVEVYRRSVRNGSYLFLEPNGDAVAIVDDEEKIIGNFFTDLNQVISVSGKLLEVHSLASNISKLV